jgi:hypothetical protein
LEAIIVQVETGIEDLEILYQHPSTVLNTLQNKLSQDDFYVPEKAFSKTIPIGNSMSLLEKGTGYGSPGRADVFLPQRFGSTLWQASIRLKRMDI